MATCATCGKEIVAGDRWCRLCRGHTIEPAFGRLAQPGKRLGAYLLDVAIPYFSAAFFGRFIGESGETAGMIASIVFFIAWITLVLVLYSRGTTIGKKILGMRVIKENGSKAGLGTMLVREIIGKFISAAVIMLGFLWILFDKDKQGWHDKLVSTFVVETAPERSN